VRCAAEMTQQTGSTDISIYLGGTIEFPWEEQFLTSLRRDLKQRGMGALILANFNVRGGSGQRQIDFWVLTDDRLAHIELKTLSQSAPVTGHLNGPWLRDLGGGNVHEIDPNPFQQAHNGTYALSDMAARLMRRGLVPEAKPFYRHIDTLVCLDPTIPTGSVLDRHAHVAVVEYEDLLGRLATPGPRPPWDPEHWDVFIRELGLYPEEHDSPTERRRRESAESLGDYRQIFIERLSSDRPELVDVAFGVGEERYTAAYVTERIVAGTSIALVGDSGLGKSHAASHIATELASRGNLVIWLDCGEFSRGQFGNLLARSTAPFSTENAGQLAAHAGRVGDRRVVVLDGFNQCPPGQQADLVKELGGFTLRFPSTILATSQTDLPTELVGLTLRATLPAPAEREAILAAYGVQRIDRVSEAFSTPFELATVSACEAELEPDATTVELYDAYVRNLAPAETTRSGLRALALALVDELRTSLRLSDATATLGGAAGLGMVPDQIDAVLSSRLLVVNQGHVRFGHELLVRFLAAEAVVLAAVSGTELVVGLAPAHRKELRWFATALERDPERQSQALTHFANAEVYTSAARGEMGRATAEQVRAAVKGVLADAAFAVGSDDLTLETSEDGPAAFFPKWTRSTAWSGNEIALLGTAGTLLVEGYFFDEAAELFDRTDDRFRTEIRTLEAAGSRQPITAMVSALPGGWPSDPFGATTVIRAAEHNRWGKAKDHTVVARLLAGARSQSWCRFYLCACICGSEEATADPTLLPRLVRAAWDAKGYHVRLHALMAVHMCGRSLDEDTCNVMDELLSTFETSHLYLQSGIVEAAAAIGRLGASLPTVEQLADFIRTEVLGMEDGPDAWRAASGVCSSQWEPDDIVGPYYETVHSLGDSEMFELCLRAAQDVDGVSRSWPMEQLCYRTPIGDPAQDERLRQVFAAAAIGPPAAHGMIDENIDSHVTAVRGLGRLGADLPPWDDSDPEGQAFHLVDQLVAATERAGVDSRPIWERIMAENPFAAVDVLVSLRFAGGMARVDRQDDANVLLRLFKRFPGELRLLFEWCLQHLGTAPEPIRTSFGQTRESFIISGLGTLGDASTVEMLKPYLSEPALARHAVDAIRQLQE
jgi:hypothetical protein